MLPSQAAEVESVRFATADSLEEFLRSSSMNAVPITRKEALEENLFLGLRLNRGLSWNQLAGRFGDAAQKYAAVLSELVEAGMLQQEDDTFQLTSRGRLLSNEVFERFIQEPGPAIPA